MHRKQRAGEGKQCCPRRATNLESTPNADTRLCQVSVWRIRRQGSIDHHSSRRKSVVEYFRSLAKLQANMKWMSLGH